MSDGVAWGLRCTQVLGRGIGAHARTIDAKQHRSRHAFHPCRDQGISRDKNHFPLMKLPRKEPAMRIRNCHGSQVCLSSKDSYRAGAKLWSGDQTGFARTVESFGG